MRVGCKARTQTTRADRFKPGRWAHPSPRSEQPHTMSNHTPNGIRAHNLNRFKEADGRTLVPGWHACALNRAPSMTSRTPSPARVCARIYLQVLPYLHHTNG